MIELSGIPVYQGIEIAPVFLYQETDIVIEKDRINSHQIQEELSGFDKIHQLAVSELVQLRDKAQESAHFEEAEIFEAHLMMADDPMLLNKIKDRIKNESLSKERAIEETKAEIKNMFLNINNDFFKARAADVEDIANRFIRISLGLTNKGFDEIDQDVILAARDLKPSETTQLTGYIKGILLEEGSQTSHVAIMAKAKGIPTIVGLTGILQSLQTGDMIILDSVDNQVIIEPRQEILASYQDKQRALVMKRKRLEAVKQEEAVTKDGRVIKLYGNIGTSLEAEIVSGFGGKGVGLFRTEFLYMNAKAFPTEEEQFREYKIAAEQGLEDVIIRTLDIGGDKSLPYYQFKAEDNPFLGLRALRFTLANADLFKTQLRAILRASAFGKISIMFPMVSSLEEICQAKALLEECKEALLQEQVAFAPDIRVGIMIEIPAAAAIADILANEVDFFSIGTNDLCQYTLAVDRMNKEVAYLYQPLHPSIIRLIKQTINAAHTVHKEVGICGEMAGEAINAFLLIGLDVDELSMSPAVLPEIKTLIRQIVYKDANEISNQVLKCRTTNEIKALLEKEVKKYDN